MRYLLGLPGALALALAVRLAIALRVPLGAWYDIYSYQVVGKLVLAGRDVYSAAEAAGRHPYLPLQLYWLAAATWLSEHGPLAFISVVKLPAIAADVALVALLYVICRRLVARAAALRRAWIYALHPVPILVTALHGQFDAIPLLCLVGAWYLLVLRRMPLAAGLALGLGVLDKTWPALLFPVLVLLLSDLRARVRFTLATALPPLLGTALYLVLFSGSPLALFRRVGSYASVPGRWGYSLIFDADAFSQHTLVWVAHAGSALVLAAGLFVAVRSWRRDDPAAIRPLLAVLAMLVVSAGFSVQYLMWLVPLALLAGEERWLWWYTGAALILLGVSYGGVEIEQGLWRYLSPRQIDLALGLAALPVWFVMLAWTASLDRRLARSCRARATAIATAPSAPS